MLLLASSISDSSMKRAARKDLPKLLLTQLQCFVRRKMVFTLLACRCTTQNFEIA